MRGAGAGFHANSFNWIKIMMYDLLTFRQIV